VLTFKKSHKVFIKGHKCFIWDQKVRNTCLCLPERENHSGKTTFLKNHWRTKVSTINICLDLSYFDQRTDLRSIFEGTHKKILKNPINTTRNQRKKKKEKREKCEDILCKETLVWRFKDLTYKVYQALERLESERNEGRKREGK